MLLISIRTSNINQPPLHNQIFKPHQSPYYVLFYLDDVLLFSSNILGHLQHVDAVLTLLNDNSIRLRLSKFFFSKNLNIWDTLTHSSLRRPWTEQLKKIESVTKCLIPKSICTIMVRLLHFYKRYVGKYSQIAAPLYQQTKKEKADIVWNS